MAFLFFLAFLCVPIIEIAVFIKVGGWLGLWPTIAIVILTAIAGTALLRRQGLSVLFRIQENLEANRVPVRELFDGACLVIAGALLLTPGFVTDAIGFALFLPPVRNMAADWLGRRILSRAEVHVQGMHFEQGTGGPGRQYRDADGVVIDGEFEDVTPGDRAQDASEGRQLPGGEGKPHRD